MNERTNVVKERKVNAANRLEFSYKTNHFETS